MHASMDALAVSPFHHSISTEPDLPGPGAPNDLPDSDAALAVRLASGDVSALEALYQRHYEPALAVALALLRDRSAAEDLVHEAFLRAWRRASSFQSQRGTFRSWLLTIVRNGAIDQLRQQTMQRRPAVAAAQETLHGPAELDVTTQVLLSLEAERLHQALAQLAPEQRRAVQQSFFAGLSHREIAEREGLRLGTVKGRVRLGLNRLRALLDSPGEVSAGQ